MRIPNSDNPYIAGFIEYSPPMVQSLSTLAVQFYIDADCKFMPVYTTSQSKFVVVEVDDADEEE